MSYGLIYKITNLLNQKCYIGQTIQPIQKRIYHHFHPNKKAKTRSAIANAIQKYGESNFKVEILTYAESQVELDQLEINLIEINNSLAPNGYNLAGGGNGKGTISEELKLAMSRRSKEYHKTHKSPTLGIKWKLESRQKLSKSKKGLFTQKMKDARLKYKFKNSAPIIAVNIQTNQTFIYMSMFEASLALDIDRASINKICLKAKNRTSADGFKFFFAKDEDLDYWRNEEGELEGIIPRDKTKKYLQRSKKSAKLDSKENI